jgi:hypothetical protein
MEEVNQSNWFVVSQTEQFLTVPVDHLLITLNHLKTANMMNLGLSAQTLCSRKTPN